MDQGKKNTIGQDFSLLSLIRFAFPSILTNFCAQMFRTLDDGLFVSRYVGGNALASISLLGPANGIIMAFSVLFTIGGSTLSAKKMGEGEQEEAKRIFSRICVAALIAGLLFSVILNVFCDPICRALGATEELLPDSRIYVRVVFSNVAINLLGMLFGSYYATAGKPKMGLICSIVNGAFNIIFDILFIVIMRMGVLGSSLSTVSGEIAVFLIGAFFYSNQKQEISFVKPEGSIAQTAFHSAKSGFSQFINSISLSLTGYVTNQTLLAILGPIGISANSIIADIRMVANAAFLGYVTCVGPIIAYNFGNKNPTRLKRILGYNLKVWFFGTLSMTLLGQLFKRQMIGIFITDTSSELYRHALEGLTIELFACMFTAGCVFVMRMFVALGAPKTASILTTLRNFVIRLSMLLILPRLWGEVGIWLAFPVAEFLSCVVAGILVYVNRDNYGYGKSGIAWNMAP